MPSRRKVPKLAPVDILPDEDEDVNNNDINNNMMAPPASPSSISSRESSVRTDGSDTSEVGDCLFSPSLSSQRHSRVLEILEAENVSSLLDTGCNNCKFLTLAKQLPSLTYLAGVDIDRQILDVSKQRLCPLAADYLDGRKMADLVVEVWAGDVTNSAGAEVMTNRVEAVTSIEIIEHLQRQDVKRFTAAVLGCVRPRVWVVTTPNSDYNSLFPDWAPGQTRHWDHKFEWSRDQMDSWVNRVLLEYPDYEVQHGGVGWKEGFHDSHGPASQMAIFRRRDWTHRAGQQDVNPEHTDSWNMMASFTFPASHDIRSRTEKIYDELIYYVNLESYNEFNRMTVTEPYEVTDQEILVKFEDVLKFDSLRKLETSAEEMRDIAAGRGEKVTEDGLMVCLNKFIKEESEEEEETYISF